MSAHLMKVDKLIYVAIRSLHLCFKYALAESKVIFRYGASDISADKCQVLVVMIENKEHTTVI